MKRWPPLRKAFPWPASAVPQSSSFSGETDGTATVRFQSNDGTKLGTISKITNIITNIFPWGTAINQSFILRGEAHWSKAKKRVSANHRQRKQVQRSRRGLSPLWVWHGAVICWFEHWRFLLKHTQTYSRKSLVLGILKLLATNLQLRSPLAKVLETFVKKSHLG